MTDLLPSEITLPISADVAESLPTPAYVYDVAPIRKNRRALAAALPEGTGLYYSVKANPHPALLAEVRASGVRPEVCSAGELQSALDAGWSGPEILYGGPGKRDQDVLTALAAGVTEMSVDSPAGLDQLDACAQALGVHARALLRVNDDTPTRGQGLAMTGVASQFGADAGWIAAEPARFAGRANVEVVGLHLYMGTNLQSVDDLCDQFDRSASTAVRVMAALADCGVRLHRLDLGGGFGAPFAQAGQLSTWPGLAQRLAAILDATVPGWTAGTPEVVFESGRYLVATAGTLLTRVLDAKDSHGDRMVILESGINHLGGMSGMRRLPPLRPALVPVDGRVGDRPLAPTTITGPLCTPLDTWTHRAELPELRRGDLVAVPNVGAYGLNASLIGFLGHPLPLEFVFDADRGSDQPMHVTRQHLVRIPA